MDLYHLMIGYRKDGGITRIVYDRNNRPVKVIRPKEYALHHEKGAGISYTYD